jgi:hypothetical protein
MEIAFAVPPFNMQEIISISLEVKKPPLGLAKVALLDKKHSSKIHNPVDNYLWTYYK